MGRRTAIRFVFALLAWGSADGVAAEPVFGTTSGITAEPYIVRDDYGGSVRQRLNDVSALRASGRAVEIRGLFCYSSCTMLLALEQVCVQPATRFGFHGPSRNGAPLKMDEFEVVSRLIASHYPPAVRDWYMDIARHSLDRLHILSGSELVARKVVKACDPSKTASAQVTPRGDRG